MTFPGDVDTLQSDPGSSPWAINKRFTNVPPDAPGLRIELNDDEVKQHLQECNQGYILPIPGWDNKNSKNELCRGMITGAN